MWLRGIVQVAAYQWECDARMVKRAFDIISAAAGLIILSPVLLAIGAAVKLHDGGAVFYRARRVGKGGELFDVLKFRTMIPDAHKQGPGITASGDARVTPVGRLLRKTKLDELPQLINVVRGEMSLVGPRPEDPRYVEQYTADQREILSIRPGITSAASLAYRNEEQLLSGDDWERLYLDEVMPAKLAIDLEYIRHRSLATDISLIVRTVKSMID